MDLVENRKTKWLFVLLLCVFVVIFVQCYILFSSFMIFFLQSINYDDLSP